MRKKILSMLLACAMVISFFSVFDTKSAQAAVQVISNQTQLLNAFAKGGTYDIRANISVSKALVVKDSVSVKLYCTAGARTITSSYSGNTITVKNGGKLTIGNTVNDTYKLSITKTAKSEAIISINNGGYAYIRTGRISSGTYGVKNNGKLYTYTGSVITDAKLAGVYNNCKGIFYMNYGSISNTTYKTDFLTQGSGIENRGRAYMYGGTINHCGKGIYNSGALDLSGGLIQNNCTFGVFNTGVLQMTAGTIQNNSASGVVNVAGFSMSGGSIKNNKEYGVDTGEFDGPYNGHYYIDELYMDYHDGTLKEMLINELTHELGIYADKYFRTSIDIGVSSPAKVVEEQTAYTFISGGTISDNAYGIHHTNGVMAIGQPTIKNNTKFGIYVLYPARLGVYGGKITGNGDGTSAENVAGIYCLGYLDIAGNVDISSNNGYGVFSSGISPTISKGSFHDNKWSGLFVDCCDTRITGGNYYNNGGYGVYARKVSFLKTFTGYSMVNNAKGNINFKLSDL